MNRIDNLFQSKKKNILSIYFTAGFPALNDSLRIIKALDKNSVDMIEIGMPFSDPVADGPVIQESSRIAIEKGMNLELLFEQLAELRTLTDIPVLLMGYINPVLFMGMERFVEKCVETGVDGCIIPDLPLEEYEKRYSNLFIQNNLKNILLISPQTSEARIRKIDSVSGGFIYVVSTYSTTGKNNEFGKSQVDYFKRISDMNLKTPSMIGFGISGRENFNLVSQYASGGIIGSAFIKSLNSGGGMEEKVHDFVSQFKV